MVRLGVQNRIIALRINGNNNEVHLLLDIMDPEDEVILRSRAEAYSCIRNLFSFFSKLRRIGCDEPKERCEYLADVYHQDVKYMYGDHLNECTQLKHCMALDDNCETRPALHRTIISDNFKSVFPNFEIALTVFM